MSKIFFICDGYQDHTGKNRGIAFIRYSKKSEADFAISELAGYTPPGTSGVNPPAESYRDIYCAF